MKLALRFLLLIIIALLGGLAFSFTVNILIMLGAMPTDIPGFGHDMTSKAVFTWLGCVTLGLISIFLEKWWRYILLFSPLYGPSLFTIIYVLIQS